MKIYVAGGSAEREMVGDYIALLRAHGFTITHDWTACEGYRRASTDAERAEWARQDLEGVRTADVVWVVLPEGKSEGSHGEMCAAIVLGKITIVSGDHKESHGRIFPLLAERHGSHDAALAHILNFPRAPR